MDLCLFPMFMNEIQCRTWRDVLQTGVSSCPSLLPRSGVLSGALAGQRGCLLRFARKAALRLSASRREWASPPVPDTSTQWHWESDGVSSSEK